MISPSTLSLVLLFSQLALAANNWNTPCLSGQCSYDLKNSTTHGTARGSLYISGSSNAISDLTAAAGWTVLNCDANSTEAQNIRAVCTGDDSTCSHVYQNGIVNTVVRLPEDCGAMPFARVAAEWTSSDQSVPDEVAQTLSRRSDPTTVRGITLDTNFHMIKPSTHGQVTMLVQGATGLNSTADIPAPSTNALTGRSIFSSIADALAALSINVNKSATHTISVNKPFNLLDASLDCPASGAIPAFTAGLTVDGTAGAEATVNYGVVAQGTIVPPKITEFGLFADFDAELDGTLDINALASASISSGSITLFQAGLPGLDFPGILTIGPSFEVNAEATASLQADASMTVGLAYKITNAKLLFPPNAGASGGTFTPADTQLQLSANPAVAGTGTVAAHLIPTILLGINALSGLAEANVNLNLDTFAELDLSLAKSSTTQLSGCTDITTGLSVNAGADASLFGLFSKSTSVTLFEKNFTLFEKCFTDTRRREHARALVPMPIHKRIDAAGLISSCTGGFSSDLTALGNLTSLGNLTTIVDEILSAISIS